VRVRVDVNFNLGSIFKENIFMENVYITLESLLTEIVLSLIHRKTELSTYFGLLSDATDIFIISSG
jgi:hypothetical protein